jgi:hypothetical protein
LVKWQRVRLSGQGIVCILQESIPMKHAASPITVSSLAAFSLTVAALLLIATATSAIAATYPVQGKWGQSTSTDKEPIDCTNLRTVDFRGERRFDSGGGVPDFRAISVEQQGGNAWRVVEEFRTGQINARNQLTLRTASEPDRVELELARGGTIKLRKCR